MTFIAIPVTGDADDKTQKLIMKRLSLDLRIVLPACVLLNSQLSWKAFVEIN